MKLDDKIGDSLEITRFDNNNCEMLVDNWSVARKKCLTPSANSKNSDQSAPAQTDQIFAVCHMASSRNHTVDVIMVNSCINCTNAHEWMYIS